ncbi:restriction endonuclease [Burkholderia sp. HI2500]|uniref:restriction endonuclease n=1 Tax=Burkholderia sp. HI2500 TaxID=2015358 RepID=UPI000B7A28CB|nr:restriction endonuclease [Burkholderia sp. HI2500]OXJ12236.1 restriction endonuclease [Burkholderia sp. HI2500]
MADAFHYPPELLELLVETIPRLSRAKKGVILFLRGAGVAEEDLAEVERTVTIDPRSISKFEIVRRVLVKVNARGDSGLRPRREIIKRVVEFESFETCWPEDQMKAKGFVASVRETVNAKDSFTRMKQEREAEREATRARQLAEQAATAEKRTKIQEVSTRLAALFGMNDQPHERGKLLESVLNDLFKAYGILVREDFRRKDPDTSVVIEQIDGVIELDGVLHIVEMKWLNSPVGTAEFFPHLSRVFLRANANGIFISAAGFTDPVIRECTTALTQKTMLLCSLHEIVMLLQRGDDLIPFFKKKSHAAIVNKNPFLQILS